MLVTRGGGLYCYPVLVSEMSDGGPIVFGGTGVAAEVLNAMTMNFVESNRFFSSANKTCTGLVANKDSRGELAEEVFEHEETDVSSDGWGADCALVINAEGLAREKTVNA